MTDQQIFEEAVWEDATFVSAFDSEAREALSRLLWVLGDSCPIECDTTGKQAIWSAFFDWEKSLLRNAQDIVQRARTCLIINYGPGA